MGEIVPAAGQTTTTTGQVKLDTMTDLDDEKLQELYSWVDEIPLSRAKRNMTRDFSDGVLVAEIVHHFVPKIVEIHNYSPANSTQQKLSNWGTLNRKVFPKLSFSVHETVVRGISNSKPGLVENLLWDLRQKLDKYLRQSIKSEKISPDGYLDGKEVGSGAGKVIKTPGRTGAGKHQRQPPQAPKALTVHTSTKALSNPARGGRPLNHSNELSTEVRLLLEEKEQNLLASQETVQILQAKVRRLEQLLQLKDIRIEEQAKRIEQLERRY